MPTPSKTKKTESPAITPAFQQASGKRSSSLEKTGTAASPQKDNERSSRSRSQESPAGAPSQQRTSNNKQAPAAKVPAIQQVAKLQASASTVQQVSTPIPSTQDERAKAVKAAFFAKLKACQWGSYVLPTEDIVKGTKKFQITQDEAADPTGCEVEYLANGPAFTLLSTKDDSLSIFKQTIQAYLTAHTVVYGANSLEFTLEVGTEAEAKTYLKFLRDVPGLKINQVLIKLPNDLTQEWPAGNIQQFYQELDAAKNQQLDPSKEPQITATTAEKIAATEEQAQNQPRPK